MQDPVGYFYGVDAKEWPFEKWKRLIDRLEAFRKEVREEEFEELLIAMTKEFQANIAWYRMKMAK